MSDQNLLGKRVLITQADMFMGPVLCDVFARHGATVIANAASLVDVEAPAAIVAQAGRVDVLVANLAIPAPSTAVVEVSEANPRGVRFTSRCWSCGDNWINTNRLARAFWV